MPRKGFAGKLFEPATRLDALERAWAKVRANRGCAGSDGVTIERFEARLAQRLLGLQRRLREGTYNPRPLRLIDIPKDEGETRRLGVPAVADRVAQTALAQALMPIVEPELAEASFAYRPGRSVQQAVRTVAGHRARGFQWVLETDIERFFDRIPHAAMLERLAALLAAVPDREPLLDLVALWLEAGGNDLGTPGCGLAQGSPLSPMLANLYLDELDERFERENRHYRLVRFADDLVVLARNEGRADRALELLKAELAGLGLGLNPEKTRVVSFEHGFHFLGHLFVRSMVLRSAHGDGADEATADFLRRVAGEDERARDAEAAAEAEAEAGLDAGLRILHVLEPGRELGVRNQAFTVEEVGLTGRQELIALPHARIDRIEVGARARVSDAALRWALATETLLHHVDGQGRTIGTTAGRLSDHAGLHLAQARCALDPEARLDLARRLVDARVRNQRALLRRLNRDRKLEALGRPLIAINKIVRKLKVVPDISALLGHEGEAARHYWPALARLVRPGWATAPGPFRRGRHPAPDALNVVLNYTAALLGRDIEALLRRHGLHPGFGCLHTAQDDHDACVFDLMEELRAPLAEGLAVYLFNNRVLNEGQFAMLEDGVRLDRAGHAPIVQGYHDWLSRPIRSPRTGRRMTWRRLAEEGIVAYARHCRGDEPYAPYVMDY